MLTEILANTPTWVFVLFFALVYLGYVQSRSRNLSAARIAMVPIALGAFSLYGVFSAFGKHAIAIPGWGIGIGIALLLNGVLKQPRGAAYINAERTYLVPGSWIPMALIMTMFFTRYIVTVALTLNAALGDEAIFAASVCLFYGLLSGTFFARALSILGSRRKAVLTQ